MALLNVNSFHNVELGIVVGFLSQWKQIHTHVSNRKIPFVNLGKLFSETDKTQERSVLIFTSIWKDFSPVFLAGDTVALDLILFHMKLSSS